METSTCPSEFPVIFVFFCPGRNRVNPLQPFFSLRVDIWAYRKYTKLEHPLFSLILFA